MRVLITAGGTKVNIDEVRWIGNRSTGSTAAELARTFLSKKAKVTYLRSSDSVLFTEENLFVDTYTTFDDLQKLLQKNLQHTNFDLIIHLAAVSDYEVSEIEVDGKKYPRHEFPKVDSDKEISLHLKPTPKLIDEIRTLAPHSTLVAFKLTKTYDLENQAHAIKKLFDHSNADFVVHNDLYEMENGKHTLYLYNEASLLAKYTKKDELAHKLFELAKDKL